MKLFSSAFKEGGIIPSRYTCEGKNIPPPLEFKDVPADTKSLVLILDDPDVPAFVRADRMWDHWILYDIPPNISKIEEGVPAPGTAGKTTWGNNQYGGPCPPDRQHRYFFKLYALKEKLDLPPGATKKEVEKEMKGLILAQCYLMGVYEKGKGY